MKNKYVFVVVMFCAILLVGMGLTSFYVSHENQVKENEELRIVTSFYPMYIATMNVTDQIPGVSLENLSEPQTGCLHDFQLTPEDMKLLSTADVFIINGGGIESFMETVAKSYPDLTVVEACEYLELLQDEDEVNAHAWMSVSNYRDMVKTIALRLGEIDPEHKDQYEENANRYDEKLAELHERQQNISEKMQKINVILFHEAYDYVAQDYGMAVKYVMDLDEERQISAGEVAEVLSEIRENDVSLILAEALYGREMAETVQKETDIKVLYLNPLNRGDYEKDSYVENMAENISQLETLLR